MRTRAKAKPAQIELFPPAPFVLSSQQAAILDWVINGSGHAVVEAVAGSGKTTVIDKSCHLIHEHGLRGLVVAFNKPIKKTLKVRLKDTDMVVRTLHSHGLNAITKFARRKKDIKMVPMISGKYKTLLAPVIEECNKYHAFGRELSTTELKALGGLGFPSEQILDIAEWARLNLVDIDAERVDFDREIENLARYYNQVFPKGLESLVIDSVHFLLTQGRDNFETVDYVDMLWLPTALKLTPQQFAWVFVDECQDLSRAALALVRASTKPDGRRMMVGDRRQAIYAWAGADSESFQRILDEPNLESLPLSVCYRCPLLVLDIARQYCPQIEARPDAPIGIVRSATPGEMIAEAGAGDMVVCRKNAPLLEFAFAFIADGKAANVIGRDIGKNLIDTVLKVERMAKGDWGNFIPSLDKWAKRRRKIARARTLDDDWFEEQCQKIDDHRECIRIISAARDVTSAEELQKAIKRMFADDTKSVRLSSIHRAKGLEAERVFLIQEREKRPGRASVIGQESNVIYVAITRPKSELIYVDID